MADTYNFGPTVPALFIAHEQRHQEDLALIARLRKENEDLYKELALRKDGWQLVPKNPTADMRIAFQQQMGPADTFYAAYTAMLDAAMKEESK
jgi:hypothetical protein